MFMEYVNIFGLKLFYIQDWFRKNAEFSNSQLNEKTYALKQHLAIMNYCLKIGVEYLATLGRGKPDDTLYHNLNELSEKIASQTDKENYQNLIKQFQINSQELISKFKSCKNKSTKNISEYLLEQLFFFSKHFGAAEEKIRIIK